MAEKTEKKEPRVTSHLSPESMRVLAETVGIAGLPDEASNAMADDITYRLKQVIQVLGLPHDLRDARISSRINLHSVEVIALTVKK